MRKNNGVWESPSCVNETVTAHLFSFLVLLPFFFNDSRHHFSCVTEPILTSPVQVLHCRSRTAIAPARGDKGAGGNVRQRLVEGSYAAAALVTWNAPSDSSS